MRYIVRSSKQSHKVENVVRSKQDGNVYLFLTFQGFQIFKNVMLDFNEFVEPKSLIMIYETQKSSFSQIFVNKIRAIHVSGDDFCAKCSSLKAERLFRIRDTQE